MSFRIFIVPLLLSGTSLPAIAQTATDIEVEAIREELGEATLDSATRINSADGPADRSAFGSRNLNVELSDNEGSTSAIVSYDLGSTTSKKIGNDPNDDSPRYSVARTQLAIKADIPLFEAEGSDASPFNFGKLGDFEKITIGFTGSFSTIKDGSKGDEIIIRARDICVRQGFDVLSQDASLSDAVRGTIPGFAIIYNRERQIGWNGFPGPVPPSVLLDDANDASDGRPNSGLADVGYKELRSRLFEQCISQDSEEGFVKKYLGDDETESYRNAYFTAEPITFYGLDATIGRNDLTFIDTALFAEQSATKTDWEASAFVGKIGAKGDWAIRGKVSYASTHISNDSMQVCQTPMMTGDMPECLEGPIGEPVKEESGFVAVEYRQRFNLGVGENRIELGIAPQVIYDIDEDEFGIDVPIYLPSKKDGDLTGGFRIGYRTDTKEVAAGFFVGVPFKVPFSD